PAMQCLLVLVSDVLCCLHFAGGPPSNNGCPCEVVNESILTAEGCTFRCTLGGCRWFTSELMKHRRIVQRQGDAKRVTELLGASYSKPAVFHRLVALSDQP